MRPWVTLWRSLKCLYRHYTDQPLTLAAFLRRVTYVDVEAWATVVKRDPCCYCGGHANSLEHVLPRTHGGRTNSDNLVGACGGCNADRAAQPLLSYLLVRQRPIRTRPRRPKRTPRAVPALRVTIAELTRSHAVDR